MILCPSLNRPHNIQRLYEVAADVPIHLWLNEGDPALDDYTRIGVKSPWKMSIGGDVLGACAVFREVFEKYPDEAFYGFIGDDVVPPSDGGWAQKLIEAAGEWYISWPDDGVHGPKLCTHPFIGGKLVRAVGQWAPEGLFHGFWDNYWATIGQVMGLLRYTPEVKFLHLHPEFDTAEVDDVYQIAMLRRYDDQAWYYRWLKDGAGQDLAQRLLMEIPKDVSNPKFVRSDGTEPLSETGDIRTAV